MIDDVSQGAQLAQVSGSQSTYTQYVIVGVSLAFLGASAVLVYIYGDRVSWGLWARAKRGWVVKGS